MHENMLYVWLPMHYCTNPLVCFSLCVDYLDVFFVTVLVFVTMLSFDTGVFLLWSMNLLVTSGNCFFIHISIPYVLNLYNGHKVCWKNYLLVIFAKPVLHDNGIIWIYCKFTLFVIIKQYKNKAVLWWKKKNLDFPQVVRLSSISCKLIITVWEHNSAS